MTAPDDTMKKMWDDASGTKQRFAVTAKLYHTLWDTDDPQSPHDAAEWTGTRDEIEAQAKERADTLAADYPFLHMEIDTITPVSPE